MSPKCIIQVLWLAAAHLALAAAVPAADTVVVRPAADDSLLLEVVRQIWLADSHPKTWLPDAVATETVTAKFPETPRGTYKLAVGLFLDRKDAVPTYRLGIRGRTAAGWYVMSDHIELP